MRIVISLMLAVTLVACGGEPTIDASSDESFAESMEKVTERMNQERVAEFTGAIMQLGLMGMDFTNPDATGERLMQQLYGKTGPEVIELAERQQALAEADRNRRSRDEYEELLSRESAIASARESLQQITIANARVTQSEGFIGTNTGLHFEVTNGLDQAISRLYWKNTVRSPGRSVPWIVAESNYRISGGLEPGEAAEWSLSPSSFEWGNKEFPEDAILEILVTRADGADGEAIYDGSELNDYDQRTLNRLRAQFED